MKRNNQTKGNQEMRLRGGSSDMFEDYANRMFANFGVGRMGGGFGINIMNNAFDDFDRDFNDFGNDDFFGSG